MDGHGDGDCDGDGDGGQRMSCPVAAATERTVKWECRG